MADIIIPNIWEGKEICICVTDERAVFVYDKEQNKFIDTGETAIELPPHGDLISRQDVIEVLKDACEEGCNDNYTNSVRRAIFDEVLEVVEDKEILPTVLEANNGEDC